MMIYVARLVLFVVSLVGEKNELWEQTLGGIICEISCRYQDGITISHQNKMATCVIMSRERTQRLRKRKLMEYITIILSSYNGTLSMTVARTLR